MTATMTAREYAHSLGLAKLGRGRLSPAAVEAIEKAKNEGMEFLPSASEIAKLEAEKRQAEGRTRKKPRVTNHEPVIVGGKPTDKVKLGEDGLPVHPPVSWYERLFAFGNFVVNPEGMTLRVVTEGPDAAGFTHFIDKAGKFWKAKVNASWGSSSGWPTGDVAS